MFSGLSKGEPWSKGIVTNAQSSSSLGATNIYIAQPKQLVEEKKDSYVLSRT